MCDYSLELYRSRPAKVGEDLHLTRFSTGSMGFTKDKEAANCASCVPVGATLRLSGIAETVQRCVGVGPVETVVMTRLEHGPHKDAVRFANGRDVCLQSLNCNVVAHVVEIATPNDSGDERVPVSETNHRPLVAA